jgi:DNA polymerase-3 subunit delta'
MAIAIQYILCGNRKRENSGANEACNLKFKNIHPDLHLLIQLLRLKVDKKSQKY